MEGVAVAVVIIESDFHDCVIGDNEGLCVGAVDGWVIQAGRGRVHGRVESRHFGGDIVDVIESASSLAVGVGGEVDG